MGAHLHRRQLCMVITIGYGGASATAVGYLNVDARIQSLSENPLTLTLGLPRHCMQGLLGANFGPGLMSAVGIKDTIARGLAAAGTAGGLGTASLTSKEPEALPFCALSYSLVGILSTLLATLPFVREALFAIVG